VSDGHTHANFTMGSALGLSVSVVSMKIFDTPQMLLTGVGCLAGLLLSPDLDVDNGHLGSWYARKIYMGHIFDVFWQPYRVSLKHRSFWSHTPIISTIIRMIYLVFPLIILIVKDQDTSVPKVLFYLLPTVLLSMIILTLFALLYTGGIDILYYLKPLIFGLIISDTGHWIKDNT